MSVEIIQLLELSILELQKVRQDSILTNERLNKIEKDLDENQKKLDEMSKYVKHFKRNIN